MAIPRIANRLSVLRPSIRVATLSRPFGTTVIRSKDGEDRAPSTAHDHRAYQKSKPDNPFVPNSTSTMTRDYPNVGTRPAPPDLLSSVDPNYKPADPYPGRVEHFTGGRQERGPQKPELGVGEMEGIKFKVEPLKRTGEDSATKRARLLCPFSVPSSIVYCLNKVADNLQIKAGREESSNQISFFPHLPMSISAP